MDQIISSLQQFWEFTGFCNMTWQHLVMIGIGIVFITLAIVKEWEPLPCQLIHTWRSFL